MNESDLLTVTEICRRNKSALLSPACFRFERNNRAVRSRVSVMGLAWRKNDRLSPVDKHKSGTRQALQTNR